MRISEILTSGGVDFTIGKDSDFKPAVKQILTASGPFDVKINGKSAFIGSHEVDTVKRLGKKYLTSLKISHDTVEGICADAKTLHALMKEFNLWVRKTDSTTGEEWGFEMEAVSR